MSQKVASMAPRWVQNEAMLGTKAASRIPKTNEVAGWGRVGVRVSRREGETGAGGLMEPTSVAQK